MKTRTGAILQYMFFFGLGIFLIWWSVKDIDKENREQIRFAIVNARVYLAIPVLIILFSSHYVRALRWRLLMEPMGYTPGKTNVFFAVMIGYLTNQAVPRLGEIVKCTVLARYEKLPAEKLIGTIILERIIDAITLLLIFAITFGIQPGLYTKITEQVFSSAVDGEDGKKISAFLITAILGAVVIAAIAAWMIIKKKTFKDLIVIFKMIVKRVWEGLTAIRHLKKRGQFIFLTVLLWGLYLTGGYVGFLAFRETDHYGLKEAFSVLSAGSLGVVIPTPGGIGSYAYLIDITMHYGYGLQKSIATAFGWLLWIAQTIVILLGGLLSFILLPWINKKEAAGHNAQSSMLNA